MDCGIYVYLVNKYYYFSGFAAIEKRATNFLKMSVNQKGIVLACQAFETKYNRLDGLNNKLIFFQVWTL